MSYSLFARFGLVSLMALAAGCAQEAPVVSPTPTVEAAANVTPIAVIERSSIPDPRVGDVCEYEVEEGVRKEVVTQRVIRVTKGYSYLVEHTGPRADGLSFRYRIDGNPWNSEMMGYREQFRYPLMVSSESRQLWEHSGGRSSDPYLEHDLTVRVTDLSQVNIPGISRPVRVVDLAIVGHYSMHDPGGNGTFGTGRITINLRYAPDLHCLVSQRMHKTRWDGSPYILETVRLIGYRPAE